MPYGTIAADTVQSSTANTAPVFRDGNSAEIGRPVRAWCNYAGSTQVVNSSFNISSVTRASTGVYNCYYSINMPSSAYAVNATNNSWACYATTSLNYMTIGAFVTTNGSAADYTVYGIVSA